MNSDAVAQHAGDAATVAGVMKAVDQEALKNALELTDWKDIESVLRSRDFEPPGQGQGAGIEYQAGVVGDTLLDLRGDDHMARRKIESPLFRSDTLRMYEEEFLEPALAHQLSELRATRTPGQPVRADLHMFFKRVSLGLMARVIGLVPPDTPAALDRFERNFQAIDDAVRVKYTTADPEEIVRLGREAQESIMEELFRPAWRRRQEMIAAVDHGDLDASELPNDLIGVALKNMEHYQKWGLRDVEREATLFITAAVATTATNVCHAVCEIEAWIGAHPEDSEKRTDEAFLEAAFNESLRLNARKWILRAAVHDTELPNGAAIREGQLIWLNFEEAYKLIAGSDHSHFNPYRTLSYGRAYGPAFADGRHMCIGKNLVLGDGVNEPGGRRGTAKMVMLELYKVGMRMDPEEKPVITDESVRTMFVSCPIVLTDL